MSVYTAGLNNLAAYLANSVSVKEGIYFFLKSLDIKENKNALYNLAGIYNVLGDNKAAFKYKQRLERIDQAN